MLTVDNRSSSDWNERRDLAEHATTASRRRRFRPAAGLQVPLDAFVAGFGQRFNFRRTQITDLRLKAKLPDGTPLEIEEGVRRSAASKAPWEGNADGPAEIGTRSGVPLLSDDARHRHEPRTRRLAQGAGSRQQAGARATRSGSSPSEAARREAIFQQSVDSEKTRGDALSKRFDEALRQAKRRAGHQADAGLRSRLVVVIPPAPSALPRLRHHRLPSRPRNADDRTTMKQWLPRENQE